LPVPDIPATRSRQRPDIRLAAGQARRRAHQACRNLHGRHRTWRLPQPRDPDQGGCMSDTAAQAPPLPSRWDQNASFWVQIIRENRDKYRTELTDPAMLQAIGRPEALAVLYAGCGEGYLARILAQTGA